MTLKKFSGVIRIQRLFLGVILIGCMCSGLLLLSYWPKEGLKEWGSGVIQASRQEETGIEGKNKVVILMWTRYYERKGANLMNYILKGREWDESCCAGEVEVTLDRDQLDKAAAIVFFSYTGNLRKNDLPKTRRPDQLWVLFGKESPHLSPGLSPYNNLFNWTMTYRADSDIWAPYGESLKQEESIPGDDIAINGTPLDKWISEKTGLLTGVISHCPTPSKRESYLKLLKNIISVDIYGNCGTTKICHRNNANCNHTAWWTELGSKYKFYFAAENSICVDYITEKFWRALELGLVPVAYGGGNYTKEAPPNSFIDVRDFPSHKELAQHLVYLNSNDDEYRKYFRWRSKYKVRMAESWQGWCNLCSSVLKFKRKLEENDDPNTLANLSHVYSNLGRWWSYKPFPENENRACSKPDFK